MARESTLRSPGTFPPITERERHLIEEELERLLASPLFRNSRRYPAFLRHVIEQTLAGQSGLLKERSIGIDLFDRPADYDTNTDHIVRTTAAEIRKRIAQYYRELGNEPRIRIELPPGSYVPEFRLPDSNQTCAPPGAVIGQSGRRRRRIDRKTALVAAMAVVLSALIALAMMRRLDPVGQASIRFWGPVLNSAGALTICVSSPLGAEPAPGASTGSLPSFMQLHSSELEHLSVGDAEALARLAGFLGSEHKPFHIRRPPISLADLRQGPVILIGGFNNEWTMRLTGELRFHFDGPQPGGQTYSISDRLNPGSKAWSFDFAKSGGSSTEDYGMISRVSDPITGRQLIIAAGIAKYGTVAASEFLTNPNLLAEFERGAPKGWMQKNVQIVVRTKVIADNSGPPEMVGVAVW